MLFYDFEFNLLLIEPKIISWRLTKYYNKIGTFEAHLPLLSSATRLVMENDFLVCSVGDEYAIITGKQVGNELVIYGRTCNWLLSKRVVLPFSNTAKSTGEFVKGLFENAYSDCDSVVFGNMEIGKDYTFSAKNPKLLSDTVFAALESDALGNELVFDKDNKRWVFNLIKGKDRLLMISEANKNASSTQVTVDIGASANVCYYKTDSGYKYAGGDAGGLYRFETYLLSADENEAMEEVDRLKKEDIIEVVATGPKYKTDYFLGDTVRVQIIKNDYKVTKRLRIKGVELISKPSGYLEKPIFEEV